MGKLKKGIKYFLSGDAQQLGISDYNIRVSSEVTLEESPLPYSKKVLVTIDAIDGDNNVCAQVFRSKLISLEEEKC